MCIREYFQSIWSPRALRRLAMTSFTQSNFLCRMSCHFSFSVEHSILCVTCDAVPPCLHPSSMCEKLSSWTCMKMHPHTMLPLRHTTHTDTTNTIDRNLLYSVSPSTLCSMREFGFAAQLFIFAVADKSNWEHSHSICFIVKTNDLSVLFLVRFSQRAHIAV